MENIDKLTLELLMNKTNYNKYMEKTNPEKHKEQREFHQKIKKYGPQIQHLTRRFLENPNYQINLEMDDMLEGYARTFIKYLEMKDLEKTCCGEYFEKEKDEDILFDPTEMNSDDDGGKAAEEDADDIENASVIAVGEPSNPCFKYTMDMYTKKKLLKKIV
jgi:hypothetical protein